MEAWGRPLPLFQAPKTMKKVYLLFTNHDFGHSFEDTYHAMKLVALVADKELRCPEDFQLATIGQSAAERTDSSGIPGYYAQYRYIYPLDGRTHHTVATVLEAFGTAQYVKEQESNPETAE